MGILKFCAEILLALPVIAFGAGNGGHVSDHMAFSGYGQDKIKICHNGETIEVSPSDLSAHLAHGDKLGKCPEKKDKDDDKKDKDKKDDKKEVEKKDDKKEVEKNSKSEKDAKTNTKSTKDR